MYGTVNRNLDAYRKRMANTYNKSTRVNDYKIGDEVLLRNRCFKLGESAKQAPRRSGPWAIIEVLPNGRNFRLKNVRNGRVSVVHHDRIVPVTNSNDIIISCDEHNDDVSSSSDDEKFPLTVAEPEVVNQDTHRYPRRLRTQRQIPGTVSWDSIEI